MWQLLDQHFIEFLECYDEKFQSRYGFIVRLSPMLCKSILSVAICIMASPVYNARTASTNTFLHSVAGGVGFAPHVTTKRWCSSGTIWKRPYCIQSRIGNMFLLSQRFCEDSFFMIVSCLANWASVRQKTWRSSFKSLWERSMVFQASLLPARPLVTMPVGIHICMPWLRMAFSLKVGTSLLCRRLIYGR